MSWLAGRMPRKRHRHRHARAGVPILCVGSAAHGMIIPMLASGPGTWGCLQCAEQRAPAVCLLRRLGPSVLTQSLGAARRDLNPHLQRGVPSASGTVWRRKTAGALALSQLSYGRSKRVANHTETQGRNTLRSQTALVDPSTEKVDLPTKKGPRPPTCSGARSGDGAPRESTARLRITSPWLLPSLIE